MLRHNHTYLSRLILGFFFILYAPSALTAEYSPINWPDRASAAAWQTNKTMFLFKSSQHVGMNTYITASIRSDAENRSIRVDIPIDKFDSGDQERDQDVVSILKGDVQKDLTFQSQNLNSKDWDQLLNGQKNTLDGKLTIGNIDYNVVFTVNVVDEDEDKLITGQMTTKFSYFGLDAPSVAGGVVAKVSDELLLHVKIYFKDLKTM